VVARNGAVVVVTVVVVAVVVSSAGFLLVPHLPLSVATIPVSSVSPVCHSASAISCPGSSCPACSSPSCPGLEVGLQVLVRNVNIFIVRAVGLGVL